MKHSYITAILRVCLTLLLPCSTWISMINGFVITSSSPSSSLSSLSSSSIPILIFNSYNQDTNRYTSRYKYKCSSILYMSNQEEPSDIDKAKVQKILNNIQPPLPTRRNKIDKSAFQTSKEENIGIGGQGGYTYDVNRLKGNLVQKSVKQFKIDLLHLLMNVPTPRTRKINNSNVDADDDIKWDNYDPIAKKRAIQKLKRMKRLHPDIHEQINDKIASLISTNPVSTTTDSNLLDGEWDFAYSTNQASELLQDAKLVLSHNQQNKNTHNNAKKYDLNGPWRLSPTDNVVGNPFISWSRQINLENLEDDEDPFMVDTIYRLNGLMKVERYYYIVGLGRTYIEVEPISKTSYILGRKMNHKENEKVAIKPMELQFIYLDSDLCIVMIGNEGGVINVYTKNEEWRESRKNKTRLFIAALSWVSSFESPFKLRKKLAPFFNENKKFEQELEQLTDEEYEILLNREYSDRRSKLMALRLGDLGYDDDQDEGAWFGNEDPFVHLSADERQEIMKQLSIGEIKQAGNDHKRLMMRIERKRLFKKQKKFKRVGWEDNR